MTNVCPTGLARSPARPLARKNVCVVGMLVMLMMMRAMHVCRRKTKLQTVAGGYLVGVRFGRAKCWPGKIFVFSTPPSSFG